MGKGDTRRAALQLDRASGWLAGVRHIVSPNCDDRPTDAAIELLVIHGISLPPGQYGGGFIDALFTNTLTAGAHPYFETICHLKVSAHVLIRRTGELTQYISFHRRAWHAGVSSFRGRAGCNDFSIGIELEGCDGDPYEDRQYTALAELTKLLMKEWPAIEDDRIVGHSDIAPGRKTDPGPAFDWERFKKMLLE